MAKLKRWLGDELSLLELESPVAISKKIAQKYGRTPKEKKELWEVSLGFFNEGWEGELEEQVQEYLERRDRDLSPLKINASEPPMEKNKENGENMEKKLERIKGVITELVELGTSAGISEETFTTVAVGCNNANKHLQDNKRMIGTGGCIIGKLGLLLEEKQKENKT